MQFRLFETIQGKVSVQGVKSQSPESDLTPWTLIQVFARNSSNIMLMYCSKRSIETFLPTIETKSCWYFYRHTYFGEYQSAPSINKRLSYKLYSFNTNNDEMNEFMNEWIMKKKILYTLFTRCFAKNILPESLIVSD